MKQRNTQRQRRTFTSVVGKVGMVTFNTIIMTNITMNNLIATIIPFIIARFFTVTLGLRV